VNNPVPGLTTENGVTVRTNPNTNPSGEPWEWQTLKWWTLGMVTPLAAYLQTRKCDF